MSENEEDDEIDNFSNDNVHFKATEHRQMIKDLEFVQMLADPQYIVQLNKRGYFYDEAFQDYIRGLKYLFKEEYLVLIKYPEGINNLLKISQKGFIEAMKVAEYVDQFVRAAHARHEEIANDYS